MSIAITKDPVSGESQVESGICFPGMHGEEFFDSEVSYDSETMKFHTKITVDKDFLGDRDAFDQTKDKYILFEGKVKSWEQTVKHCSSNIVTFHVWNRCWAVCGSRIFNKKNH